MESQQVISLITTQMANFSFVDCLLPGGSRWSLVLEKNNNFIDLSLIIRPCGWSYSAGEIFSE